VTSATVVNVKPTEHAFDRDGPGRVNDHHRIRWYALAEPLLTEPLLTAMGLGGSMTITDPLVCVSRALDAADYR
jgi:hypothetical protein